VRILVVTALNLAALPAFALAPAGRGAPPPPVVTRVAPPIVRTRPPVATVAISPDGKSIFVDGSLEPGTAARFKAMAAAASNLRTVVLQSNGGRLAEAIDISEIVRARGLDTYVETWCYSACTVILLAGRDRAASPRARIGFHEPVFPGAKAADIPSLRSVSRRIYDDAGVRPNFTDRAFATPSSDMWFPSSDELRSAQVLTRISLSGETTVGASHLKSREDIAESMNAIPFWPALKARYPEITSGMIEEAWRAKEAGLNDNEIVSAGRAVLMKNYHRILASASDALLADYLDLVVEQAEAARALSFEACDKAFKGQLNVAATLPKPLVDREVELLTKVLASPVAGARRPTAPVEALIGPLANRLPVDQLAAVGATGDDYSRPARCDGMIALLREIQKMPPAERTQVIQALFLQP
jgi:hypothetical protein